MATRFFTDRVRVFSLGRNPIQVLLIWSNPVRSGPGFVNPIRSDPVHVLSIRSDPIRSWFCKHPNRSDAGVGLRAVHKLLQFSQKVAPI